jgi:hypothetical protein
MSTIKIVAIIGACLLLEGCVPIAGIKNIALLVSIIAGFGAVIGAAWSSTHNKNTDRVCQKAEDLDNAVTAHEKAYHGASPVVSLHPVRKGNGIARPDKATHFSQRV